MLVVGGGKSTSATSNAPQTHLKRTSNSLQTHFKRSSNASQTQLKRTSKYLKINKFTKSPSSRAGMPTFGFLVTVIKQPWRWSCGQVRKILSIRICTLGDNMGHKNCRNSGPRASPGARIWHALSYHIPRGFAMPKGGQP